MITRILLFCIWTFSSAGPSPGQSWTTVRPGLDLLRGSFIDQNKVDFLLLRYDPGKNNRIRIIDTYHEMGSQPYSEFSVDAIQHKTGAMVVVNAGSTKNLNSPNPAGLLKIKGTVVSALNPETPHGGTLCIGKSGDISIAPLSQKGMSTTSDGTSCRDAVQRGPFLSAQVSSVPDTWRQHFQRTIVATDKDGRLLIMVTQEPASLEAISRYFFGADAKLGTTNLLNMDGAESSGLILRSDATNLEAGNIHGLVASAIAIY